MMTLPVARPGLAPRPVAMMSSLEAAAPADSLVAEFPVAVMGLAWTMYALSSSTHHSMSMGFS